MAIQPIDLSTMYSQMNNVAKAVAHQQNGAQLTQAMQENVVLQQEKVRLYHVQKAAENESSAGIVKDEGRQKNSFQNQNGRKTNQPDEEQPEKITEIREAFLGQNIDISR